MGYEATKFSHVSLLFHCFLFLFFVLFLAVSTINYLYILSNLTYISDIYSTCFTQKQHTHNRSLDCHKDFVADVTCNENYSRAVSAGGDGTISLINFLFFFNFTIIYLLVKNIFLYITIC